ncbi:hypothetical protein ElyMa_006387400 [Elysia marginata]|uniref:Uncharacterized protein n=1 Tax=Elysia marginata TaxID=1093978 RepID=A0AAV4HR09_9GAST|nr:hypothetical protein ElyMa_006387400 [Elysia marginata]
MKRVQAMVSGKKKQCTKVSKPDISGPVNNTGKMADSSQPGQISTTGGGGGGQTSEPTPGVLKSGPRSPQPGTRRAAASLETSPGVARRGNASKIPVSINKQRYSQIIASVGAACTAFLKVNVERPSSDQLLLLSAVWRELGTCGKVSLKCLDMLTLPRDG